MMNQRYYVTTHAKPGRRPFQMNAVIGLILLNVVGFFVLSRLLPWWHLALSAPGIRQLKIWQLVSYMFLHGGVGHLFFNMWGLYLFGQHVLARLGTRRFLTLYFVSGLSGAVFWLLFNWNSRFPVIGASGAVFGVMMAAAMFFPNMRIMLLIPPIPMTLKTFVLVYGGIEVISEISNLQGGVAHLAHLGGFLGAYCYIRLLSGERLRDLVTTSPFAVFRSGQKETSGQMRSDVNRATFERMMADIEKIERSEE